MDAALILNTACALVALSALGGVVMAGIRFAGKPHPPSWLAMLHGLLAAAALTLLIFGIFTVGLPTHAVWATVLFVAAAGGGIILNLCYHIKDLPLPKWLVLTHGAIAVVGFVLLLSATFGMG